MRDLRDTWYTLHRYVEFVYFVEYTFTQETGLSPDD